MKHFHILNRRSFLSQTFKTSMAVALSTLVDIPFVMKRALAEGSIGLNGKKVLFIWLRGANDGLNSVIPVEDPTYYSIRQQIAIQKEASVNYAGTTGGCFDATQYSSDAAQTVRATADNTYSYDRAIRLGNGFAALHPSLKFLAPVYNAGDLALIHRVAYPKQSRSHFDSQNYWENGNPNNNLSKDGIFYRTIMESGLAHSAPLTGISIQSALPLILRGSDAAMTNLTSPTRYDLLGVPTPAGDNKAYAAIGAANYYPFPAKRSRELLDLQYQNMSNTLRIFANIDFSDTGNTFVDNVNTDADSAPYYLFPTSNAKNGGYALHANNANKYVVPTNYYGFFGNLKAAAMILNKTDAIIAGTELGGFDTHQTQGGAAGAHSNLQRDHVVGVWPHLRGKLRRWHRPRRSRRYVRGGRRRQRLRPGQPLRRFRLQHRRAHCLEALPAHDPGIHLRHDVRRRISRERYHGKPGDGGISAALLRFSLRPGRSHSRPSRRHPKSIEQNHSGLRQSGRKPPQRRGFQRGRCPNSRRSRHPVRG